MYSPAVLWQVRAHLRVQQAWGQVDVYCRWKTTPVLPFAPHTALEILSALWLDHGDPFRALHGVDHTDKAAQPGHHSRFPTYWSLWKIPVWKCTQLWREQMLWQLTPCPSWPPSPSSASSPPSSTSTRSSSSWLILSFLDAWWETINP